MKYLRIVLLLLVAALLPACATLEVCYTHSTYGEVCVKLNGKEYTQNDALPPPIKAQVEAHVADLKKSEPPR